MRFIILLVLVLIFVVAIFGFFHSQKPLPEGLDYRGPDRSLAPGDVRFFADVTAYDQDGEQWVRQEVFDEVIRLIEDADSFIVADFFLINDFAGGVPEGLGGEPLSQRFTNALVDAKRRSPDMPVILISDPLNTVYGSVNQPYFNTLKNNGIEVVETDVRKLRDSNLVFSPFWRTFFQWWGDPQGELLQNPLGEGRIGLSAMLELLNFKANHRKSLVVGNSAGDIQGLVTSGNPHSASVLHGNVALAFSGPLAVDLLRTEEAVYRMSTGKSFPARIETFIDREFPVPPSDEKSLSAVVLTEKAIKRDLMDRIDRLDRRDQCDLAMFYFSDMDLRAALGQAVSRGAKVRLLMDPNKDAFGREKNGIPNRQVAEWLVDRGVEVRWYRTGGEQFHSKMALFEYDNVLSTLVLGSANWTRRNLDNLNLETCVSITGPSKSPVFQDAENYFSFVWTNGYRRGTDGIPNDLVTSAPYSEFRDPSVWRRLLYWIMEKSGASTF